MFHISSVIARMTHEHDFGEWIETNKHAWSHAKTLYRTCKTCYEDEYRLIELNCPQYKIKGKNCHWCERYEEEWQRRLKNMTFDGEFVATKQRENNREKYGIKEMKDRNFSMYTMCINGATYQEIGNRFGLSRARVFQIVKTCQKKQTMLEFTHEQKINRI